MPVRLLMCVLCCPRVDMYNAYVPQGYAVPPASRPYIDQQQQDAMAGVPMPGAQYVAVISPGPAAGAGGGSVDDEQVQRKYLEDGSFSSTQQGGCIICICWSDQHMLPASSIDGTDCPIIDFWLCAHTDSATSYGSDTLLRLGPLGKGAGAVVLKALSKTKFQLVALKTVEVYDRDKLNQLIRVCGVVFCNCTSAVDGAGYACLTTDISP